MKCKMDLKYFLININNLIIAFLIKEISPIFFYL